ncbi:MAG: alanine racemase C-terminal domain-containing protein, partial [Acidimicrobiales bacterium]|nr:alanine racemase C-terminal domain-containing protein [Acidimicrobiales bacterium]
GGTWTADRESTIATLAVGYADGWSRLYVPGAHAVVRGRRVPLVGRVSSDAVAVDVTDIDGFGAEDELTLLDGDGGASAGGDRAPSVEDLAELRYSIAWDVLDSFSPRLSRVYVEQGVPVAVRSLDGVTRLASSFALQLAPRHDAGPDWGGGLLRR